MYKFLFACHRRTKRSCANIKLMHIHDYYYIQGGGEKVTPLIQIPQHGRHFPPHPVYCGKQPPKFKYRNIVKNFPLPPCTLRLVCAAK